MLKLDPIDIRILELLQSDAKMNIKEIASELGMTKTPIYERIKRLERNGVIDKYVAIVNQKVLPSSMIVFCSVMLEGQRLEEIEQFKRAILEIPEVVQCYLMGGANDFLLKVVVKDLEAYHQFSSGKLATLPNVSQIKSTFVLHEVKHSTVYPVLE
ncbi:MAG: Lrp/AsnC family transcriptional regulator [Cytophagales bacterium]|nr:Lrp/AsnC family transcriptional regulator [Cytophagales bacterium]